jgi:hypothetical protein
VKSSLEAVELSLLVSLFVIGVLLGMYAGIKIVEGERTCNYREVIAFECPKQDPVAWYTLTDGEVLECNADAVINKTMPITKIVNEDW